MKKKPSWNKDLKIPFKEGQGMLPYSRGLAKEMLDNHIFDEVLGLTGFIPTSNSYLALFTGIISGLTYYMYVSDFDKVVRQGRFKKGYINGKFVFTKKGIYYSIKLYE